MRWRESAVMLFHDILRRCEDNMAVVDDGCPALEAGRFTFVVYEAHQCHVESSS